MMKAEIIRPSSAPPLPAELPQQTTFRLMGYNPETSYDTAHHDLLIDTDKEYLDFLMEHTPPTEEFCGIFPIPFF